MIYYFLPGEHYQVSENILRKAVISDILTKLSKYINLEYLPIHLFRSRLITEYDQQILTNPHIPPREKVNKFVLMLSGMGDEKQALFLLYQCLMRSAGEFGGPAPHQQLANMLRYQGSRIVTSCLVVIT